MKRFAVLATVAFFLAAAVPLTSQAQMESESAFKIGPRATIALGDISDFGGDFAIGADLRYDLSGAVGSPIQLNGAFDFYLVDSDVSDDASAFTVDINGLYNFPVEGSVVAPYGGAGFGIVRTSVGDLSDTDFGINLVGGAEFGSGSLRPFAQGQVSFGGDFTRFGITGGVLFAL